MLGHLGDESPLALVGDVLVGAAVELLHARQELLGRHAAHHRGDAVDHGEAVLGAGHRQVGQPHPLLRTGLRGPVQCYCWVTCLGMEKNSTEVRALSSASTPPVTRIPSSSSSLVATQA